MLKNQECWLTRSQIVQPAHQVRSLSQLTLSEGFEKNRNGRRTIMVGVDARSVRRPLPMAFL
jgi:hypothetical protein